MPAATAWLVDTFQAAATLGTADPAVTVLDGPSVADTSSPLLLWVGVDDPDDPAPLLGSADQSWAGLGAQRKDERLSIACCARAWSGDTDIRAVRAAAFGILGAAEDIVRANANLGGTVLVTLSGITAIRSRTAVKPDGALCDVKFQVDAKARI